MIDPRSLKLLEWAGLIHTVIPEPDLEYAFRHALIQDAAYGSVLLRDRKELHLLVGMAMESLYPEQASKQAPVLAMHFWEAGARDRALQYYRLAGDESLRRFARAEASAHYARALEIAKEGVIDADSLPLLEHLYLQLGRALELDSRFERALAVYQDMAALSEQTSAPRLGLLALLYQGQLFSTANELFDPKRGEQFGLEALEQARNLGDPAAQAKSLQNLMNLYFYTGRNQDALARGEESLDISRSLRERSQLAHTLNDISHVYAQTGQSAQARAAAREASTIWRDLGNLPMLTDSLSSAALYFGFTGDYRTAASLAGEANEISVQIENDWGRSYSLASLGFIHWVRGEPQLAIETMQRCIALGESGGAIVSQIFMRVYLTLQYVELGAFDLADEVARTAVQRAQDALPGLLPLSRAALAEVLRASGDLDAARRAMAEIEPADLPLPFFTEYLALAAAARLELAGGDLDRADQLAGLLVERVRHFELLPFLGEAVLLRAEVLFRRSRPSAETLLQDAAQAAEQSEALPTLWKVLALQARWHDARGDRARANDLLAQARGIIRVIAEKISDPDLRASFQGLPLVRQVHGAER